MQVMNFIVVHDKIKGRNSVSYTVDGEVYIPIGKPVPIIQVGIGCIGIGTVRELLMRETATEITFDVSKDISKEAKIAYYNLYRNQISSGGSSEDRYATQDAIIPGAMRGLRNSGGPNTQSNSRFETSGDFVPDYGFGQKQRDRRGSSLSDFLDDDFRL